MLAKHWKKFGILILVIACIINVSYKLLKSTPIKEELSKTSEIIEEYMENHQSDNNNEKKDSNANN